MRPIDADAFQDELEELRKYASPDFSPEIYRIQARIAVQPTIEPVPTESEFKRIAVQRGYVPVVRCRDCKWYCVDEHQCEHQICMLVFDDDFCSYGERKGGDE